LALIPVWFAPLPLPHLLCGFLCYVGCQEIFSLRIACSLCLHLAFADIGVLDQSGQLVQLERLGDLCTPFYSMSLSRILEIIRRHQDDGDVRNNLAAMRASPIPSNFACEYL
jgi:hypothetical protein